MRNVEGFRRIAVIGSGAIGQGITQLVAMAGYEVVLMGRNEGHLHKGKEKIAWSLDKLVEKNRCYHRSRTRKHETEMRSFRYP